MRTLLSPKTITMALVALLAVLFTGCSSQRAFPTPELAVDSLVEALQSPDSAPLQSILGKSGTDLLSSGDPVADQNSRDTFLDAYRDKHILVAQPNGDVTLVVGNNDWPMPIPLVKGKDGWIFDVDAGKDEIISRRVGRNELDTIQTCLAIVDAQRDYAQLDPEHVGTQVYAQKFFSDEGKKNGLYWKTAEGQEPSPLGELVAEAQDLGYTRTQSTPAKPSPYRGYRFRMLKAQGPSANGGELDYMHGDKMFLGFAVVAYPAEYGKSGVQTFIVNQEGVVYQKDLGDGSDKIASEMKAFDPGAGWTKVASADKP